MPVRLRPVRFDPPLVTVVTDGLRAVGHPELRLTVREDLVPPQQLHWLADVLAAPILRQEDPARWDPDDVLTIGWTDIRLRTEDDVLAVEEWDHEAATFVPGVTTLLRAIGEMNDVLSQLGVPDAGSYPSGAQLASSAAAPGPLHLRRDPPTAAHSGWRRVTDRPLADLPLWELVRAHPAVRPALALPPGSEVVVDGGRIVDVRTP